MDANAREQRGLTAGVLFGFIRVHSRLSFRFIGGAKLIEPRNNSIGYFSMCQFAGLDPEVGGLMIKWNALL